MSVAYTIRDSEIKVTDDSDKVHLIRDADLYEISIGENGVVKQAFAQLIDVSQHDSLVAECKSGKLFEQGLKRQPYKSPADQRKEALAAYGIVEHCTPRHLQTF
jgi:hypothetical protein